MKMIRPARIWCIIGILSMVLLAQGVAWGTSIAVLNPSFELQVLSPPVGNSTDYNYSIVDWNVTGVSGTWYPAVPATGSTYFFNVNPPNGNQVAYSNGGTIFQTLSTPLVANAIYSLNVYLGHRNDIGFPGYTVALYAGANLLASDSSIVPPVGGWQEDTVTFHSTGSTPGIGQDLVILLGSPGAQVDFDKVSLSVSTVPMPPSALLLATGLIPLVWVRRQKRLGQ